MPTPRSTIPVPSPVGGSRRGLRSACAVALLIAAGAARADGFQFAGDVPAAPHVMIDLTGAQVREIGRHEDGRWPEIELTPAQRARLAHVNTQVRWVFAVRKEALVGACTCGAYNLGVVVGRRLAVLEQGLGDHLGRRDIASMERALIDPRLSEGKLRRPPVDINVPWTREDAPAALRAAVAGFPGEAFDTELRLSGGWAAQTLRVAAIPRVRVEGGDIGRGLHTMTAVRATPSPAATIQWPTLGARLEAGGRVYLLVPGIEEAELGPDEPAWFVLEYRDGLLTAAVGFTGSGGRGTWYEWPEPGP